MLAAGARPVGAASRPSRLPVMVAASREPRQRRCRGAWRRSTASGRCDRFSIASTVRRLRCWSRGRMRSLPAAPSHSGRRSTASGRCDRFSIASTVRRLRCWSRGRMRSLPAAARRCRSAGSAAPRGSARKVQTNSRRSPVAAWDPAKAGSAAQSSRPLSPTHSANRSAISALTAPAPRSSRSPSVP